MAGFPNAQSNPAGAIPVWLAPAPAASGLAPKAANITDNSGTLVKTGKGVFYGLTVNTAGTTSTAKVYDGIDASGTLLGTFSTTAQGGVNAPGPGIALDTGLFVVTDGGAAADITVVYA